MAGFFERQETSTFNAVDCGDGSNGTLSFFFSRTVRSPIPIPAAPLYVLALSHSSEAS